MNKVIKVLILSDIIILAGFGLSDPIFAIFLKDDLAGGSIAAAGIAATIYLLAKAILQVPIGRWTDQEKGSRRELYTMFFGSALTTIVPVIYIFSTTIYHVYLAQVLHGLGAALAYPGWIVLFTRFLDRNKEGYEWSTYNTMVGLGAAATAALGGFIAEKLGFDALFTFVAIFSFVGTMILILLFKQEISKKRSKFF
jgi:MFS family permease